MEPIQAATEVMQLTRSQRPFDFYQQRAEETKAEDHKERELEASLKELLRIPDQNDQAGGGEGIEQIAGSVDGPAGDDDRHHDRRANRRSLPARDAGVSPDQRNDD